MTLQPGHTHTSGAQLREQGVNFCLAAPNAQMVELCLFDASATQEVQRLVMQGPVDGLWHGFLPGAEVGLVYGWRVHGPWNPVQGQRFNPAKLLLDPAAREVVGRYDGDDIHVGHVPGDPSQRDTRDNAATALKARVVQDLPLPLGRVQVDPAQRVLYELHLKGFTALHTEIPDSLRGTYAGLAHPAAIAHLRSLGVTTVCLMPVAHRADEVRLLRLGLSNYWGYSPIAWNAPEHRYWSGTPGTTHVANSARW
jgi:glycogen debranching enzyme